MSDHSKNYGPLLAALVLILVVAVGVQSYYLYSLHNELREANPTWSVMPHPATPASTSGAQTSKALATKPSDAWADAFFAPLTPQDSSSPFDQLANLRERMNRLFDETWQRFGANPQLQPLAENWAFVPQVDMREASDSYVVKMDLPGIKKDELNVEITDRMMTVSGTRQATIESKDAAGASVVREREMGRFARSVVLPGPVDPAKAEATYKDGVLTLTLPKSSAGGGTRTVPVQ